MTSLQEPQSDSTYIDALNNYYKLKNEYEKKYNAKKSKILNNNLLTIKDKKKEINNLKKKCVNCERDGGTIFKYQDNNLIAMCGVLNKPCNLNISIKKSKVTNIKNLLDLLESTIENTKINIIKVKLDFLFNYNNQETSLQLFQKYKEELENINVQFNDIFIKYMDITKNEERKNKLTENLIMQNNIIEKIKLLNKEFNKTNSAFLISDITEIYINELSKLNDIIINEKYKYNNVELFDTTAKKEDSYKLFQEKNKINEFEIILENPNVNSYKK